MKETALVRLDQSGIHNFGLYAKTDIKEDSPIIQYVGDRLTQRQADKFAEKTGEELIYLFELNNRYVINGDVDYNLAKYINHSCKPNCYNDIIKGQIWIYAMRDIKAGEELSYDYGFSREGWQKRPCHCRMANCFGFVVARDHWSGIRRTKRYKSLLSK